MRSKLLLFVLICVCVVVAGIAVRLVSSLRHSDASKVVAPADEVNAQNIQTIKPNIPVGKQSNNPKRQELQNKRQSGSDFYAKEADSFGKVYEDETYKTKWQPLIEQMQAFMDDGNSEMALVDARQLMTAPNPLARRAAINLFRWVGEKALPEISRMLADPKAEIAQAAYDAWEVSFDEISNHNENIVSTVQAIVRVNDEDVRNAMLLKITSLSEKTAAAYLRALLDEPNREVADLALEYVSFMAQETMQDKSEAIKWIAGLKNVSN